VWEHRDKPSAAAGALRKLLCCSSSPSREFPTLSPSFPPSCCQCSRHSRHYVCQPLSLSSIHSLVCSMPKPSSTKAAGNGSSSARRPSANTGRYSPSPLPLRQPSNAANTGVPNATSTTVRFARARRWPLFFASASAFGLSFYTFFLYTSLTQAQPCSHNIPSDVSDRYDRIAGDFDNDVRQQELWTGLLWLRRRMTRKATGDVLEVAAGTGRNTAYYDVARCRSVTLLDLSGPMLDIAKRKWREQHPAYRDVRFLTQSALHAVPLPPASSSSDVDASHLKSLSGSGGPRTTTTMTTTGKLYDTTMATMSLCSNPAPVAQLQQMASLTEPSGKILLLEHGRSHYEWLNRILDNLAPARADHFGCWWNRDIGKILEQSGLEITKIQRWHLGTTWWIEARPAQRRVDEEEKDTRR